MLRWIPEVENSWISQGCLRREQHIRYCLSCSVTTFFKTMDADLFEELVKRLASEGVEAIKEDNEVLQTAVTGIFPEAKYDFMRAKEGDYEVEGNLSVGLHGAMLFLGKTIQGQQKVIHAKKKKSSAGERSRRKSKN